MGLELTAERDRLMEISALAGGIIVKQEDSLFSRVLLKKEDGALRLEAGNVELFHQATLLGEDVESTEGEVAILYKDFMSVVNSMPKGKVKVLEQGKEVRGKPVLTVKGPKRIKFNLVYQPEKKPALGFPSFDSVQTFGDFSVDFLRTLLEILSPVTQKGKEDYKRFGVRVERVDGGRHLRMVLTDGHRLILVDGDASAPEEDPLTDGIIFPPSFVTQLQRICQVLPPDETLGLFLGREGGQKFFVIEYKAEGLCYFTACLENEASAFPEYKSISFSQVGRYHVLDCRGLQEAVGRLTPLTNVGDLTFVPEEDGGYVAVQGVRSRALFSREEVEMERTLGAQRGTYSLVELEEAEQLRMGVDLGYFADALKTLHTPKVALGMTSPLEPLFVIPYVDAAANLPGFVQNHIHVIMPVRADWNQEEP